MKSLKAQQKQQPLKHDCYFAHTDPKELVCEDCPKTKGCTRVKPFLPHDCYYSEKQPNCETMCFHRFYCTFNVVLPPQKPFKYDWKGVPVNPS